MATTASCGVGAGAMVAPPNAPWWWEGSEEGVMREAGAVSTTSIASGSSEGLEEDAAWLEGSAGAGLLWEVSLRRAAVISLAAVAAPTAREAAAMAASASLAAAAVATCVAAIVALVRTRVALAAAATRVSSEGCLKARVRTLLAWVRAWWRDLVAALFASETRSAISKAAKVASKSACIAAPWAALAAWRAAR